MHTDMSKPVKISQEERVQPTIGADKNFSNVERVPAERKNLSIDGWISTASFKQFGRLEKDYRALENLKISGSLKNRLKNKSEGEGNIHYFCLDFLKRAVKNAEFFEATLENERNEKHLKKRRAEVKQEMWQNLKVQFQAKFKSIKRLSSSL